METSTVLVAGATGFLGNEICHQLTSKHIPVRAMIRTATDPSKTDQLSKQGVQVKSGDLRNSETFSKILQGATTVIATVSSIPFSYLSGENDIQKTDLEGMKNFIDGAKSAGVQHFIYTSFSGQIDIDFPLRNAKRSVEQHLQKTGMNYTILRPGFFMELWLSPATGFDARNGKVSICGSGINPVSYISVKDVAKFTVESISNPYFRNTTIELGGPQNVSQLEAVKIFEEVLHRKIEIQQIPVDVLREQFNNAGDPMQKSFSGLMICLANGDSIDMNEILKIFPVKLTSVRDYIQRLVRSS